MKRTREKFLKTWLNSENRKPLVIRGARQVGKTWLVRHLAKKEGLELIEINFEKNPQLISLFSTNDPKQILLNLGAALNLSIIPEKSLLFLDEIQAAPELLAKLRWFAEDLSILAVIAAGSLLEFVLNDHAFSMPVGRISYMHLEPLSFEEFLLACDKNALFNYITEYKLTEEIPLTIHETLISHFKEYIIVGGMPAAVSVWCRKNNLQDLNQVHQDLLATYRDDFAKYHGKIIIKRMEEVMMAVPRQLGQKFMYSRVNSDVPSSIIKDTLELLCQARICYQIRGCAANGVPLAAELLEKHRKAIFLDVGLSASALGISFDQLVTINDLTLINKGAVAEQVVGQILRTLLPPFIEPSLYYWHREEKGSSAEVDYIIQNGNNVLPIEVKAGKTGSLKSLHLFMKIKALAQAVRINSDLPNVMDVDVKIQNGESSCYRLFSLPFYLLSQLFRILEDYKEK